MNYQAEINKQNLYKSNSYPVGTVRTWTDGKKYEKQGDGSWKEVSNSKENSKKEDQNNDVKIRDVEQLKDYVSQRKPIGKTSSGKEVFFGDPKTNTSKYKDFTKKDHEEAAAIKEKVDEKITALKKKYRSENNARDYDKARSISAALYTESLSHKKISNEMKEDSSFN